MSSTKRYPKQIRANVSQRLHGDISHIAEREGKSISEVSRKALQLYVDRYDEIKTNKRYFQKTFRERIDRMGEVVIVTVLFMAFLLVEVMKQAGFIEHSYQKITLINDALYHVNSFLGWEVREELERLSRGSPARPLNVLGDESVDFMRRREAMYDPGRSDDWLFGDDLPSWATDDE